MGHISALLIAAAAARAAGAEAPAIDHAAVACVVAEKFPRFQARIEPSAEVARALVRFRTDAARPWYAVAMKPEGTIFTGVLPKPKKSLKSFQYYIDVTDRAFATSRTPEHTIQVVPGAAACQGTTVAGAVGSASVLLEVPAGAPPLPAGFGSAGIAAASSGAAVAAGAAAGGGVGIGTVAAIVGGGAVAAGAAVAVAAASGGDKGDGQEGSEGRQPPQYDVTFNPNIDVSTCRPGLSWCCQVLHPDANGNFDETWAPNQPNTARLAGRVTDTTFTATITCTSGGPSGSLSASGSGGSYQGSFSFGTSRGSLAVSRRAP
jgi:hypothetical protein